MTTIDHRPVSRLKAQVLVVGGGAAGVAAAVTAARQGLDVLVVERYGFCGGGAVAGLSGTICGMYASAEQVDPRLPVLVHGLLDEFVERMEHGGGLTGPVLYGKTYTRVHDPLVWRETADAMLADANVRVLFHALVTDVLTDGGERVAGAVVVTKEGRIEIRADLVIDASGDAEIVAMAGLPYTVGRDGQVQNPTMIFRLLGADIAKLRRTYGADSIMPAAVMDAIVDARGRGFDLPRTKIFLFETPRPGELLCNATRIVGRDGRELNSLRAADFTEAEQQGRLQARAYARFLRENVTGCEHTFMNDTGVQVGIRQTRQLVGMATLSNEQVQRGGKAPDGIVRSAWPIELHKGAKPHIEWLLDDYYEVPFGCFVPQRGEGLLVAGRCLSAEHEAMASARVTAQCFAYGHAIGHAAAISIRDHLSSRDIPGAEVRRRLNADGARLD